MEVAQVSIRPIYEKAGIAFSRLHPMLTLYSRSEREDALGYGEIHSMILEVY